LDVKILTAKKSTYKLKLGYQFRNTDPFAVHTLCQAIISVTVKFKLSLENCLNIHYCMYHNTKHSVRSVHGVVCVNIKQL